MDIIVPEEFGVTIVLQYFRVEIMVKLKNGALIRDGMGMCYGALITRLGDNNTATVRIKRTAENIEQEIAFAYKADAESLTVFRFGSNTLRTPAPEIQYAVKIGCVQGMYVGIHEKEVGSPKYEARNPKTKVRNKTLRSSCFRPQTSDFRPRALPDLYSQTIRTI
jgi:hypothetical protein